MSGDHDDFFYAQGEFQVKQYKDPLICTVGWLSQRALTFITSYSALGLLGCALKQVEPFANAAQSSAARDMPMGGQNDPKMQRDVLMKMKRGAPDKMMKAMPPVVSGATV
jgi:hypothetical protein